MKTKIAFLSAGLGNISRGFEISAATWFAELKDSQLLEVRLFSGGNYESATKVWNTPRNGRIATFLRRINLIKDGCRLERITFGIGFLFQLLSYRPDIIWLQEGTVGDILLFLRRTFGFSYKILFCDGAPIGYEAAKQFDYLIFLHEYALKDALEAGADPERCAVIPHLSLFPGIKTDKNEARKILNLDPDKIVIICVAAWNRHHKRIDYLLKETAKLGPGVTLLLCGQPEKESDALKEEAAELGIDVHWRTLTQKELSVAYMAADIFVLPSLFEGLPAVIIEAGAHKLPVIAHPHMGARFALGEDYEGLTDLSKQGNFSAKAHEYMHTGDLDKRGEATYKLINSKFNKNLLIGKFINFTAMIQNNQQEVNRIDCPAGKL